VANLPADIINQALDAIGCEATIGELEEGTREAQVALRAYSQCIQQLLRAAHWDFARKEVPLIMAGDRTRQTPFMSELVPAPWAFSYLYPTDCLKVRFVPYNNYYSGSGSPNGNLAPPDAQAPISTTLTTVVNCRLVPARFVITTDPNLALTNPQYDWWNQPGVSPDGGRVICTNVAQAQCVYTAKIMYPNMWDSQFRAAVVAYIASELAMPLTKDKKLAMAIRNSQIMIAKDKIMHARLTDGNEGWYSTDHVPDFIKIRSCGQSGWGGMNDSGGPGYLGLGYDSCGFSDGSSY